MKSVIKAPIDFRVIQRQLISLLNDEIACREGCCSDEDKRRSWPGGKPMAEFVEGKRPVLEALKANIPAKCLYVADGLKGDKVVSDVAKRCHKMGVSVKQVKRSDLDAR